MNYKEISLTRAQWDILSKIRKGYRRNYVLRWARRSGKNYLAMVIMIQTAIEKPGSRSLFVGKSSSSARITGYEVVVAMLRDQWSENFFKGNASKMEIALSNGSVIAFGSSGEPDGMRGQEIDGLLICDEIDFHGSAAGSNFDETFESILRPMTSRTMAPIIFTSTPRGVGLPLHKRWLLGERYPDQYHLSHVKADEADIIPAEELAIARAEMSDAVYREEYEAEFMSASSRVYPHFNEMNTVPTVVDNMAEIYVGLDHNISQSTAIIAQLSGKDTLEIIDEIVLTNSNTRTMAISINARYPNRNITVFPDPSGKARKTSASMGETDHTMLADEGLRVVSPKGSYLISDRVNTVNNMVLTADGRRRLM